MKFKISPKTHPNIVGEYLRDQFFDQSNDLRGCYSTFELMPDVIQLDEERVLDCEDGTYFYQVSQKLIGNKIVWMKYYWDGDGVLEFHFENGSKLINNDCKKDYVWQYYKE